MLDKNDLFRTYKHPGRGTGTAGKPIAYRSWGEAFKIFDNYYLANEFIALGQLHKTNVQELLSPKTLVIAALSEFILIKVFEIVALIREKNIFTAIPAGISLDKKRSPILLPLNIDQLETAICFVDGGGGPTKNSILNEARKVLPERVKLV